MKILLISTYELGHQPFGLASLAAWLQQAGFEVHCADCAVDPLPEEAAAAADVIAFYVPMHTATRLAINLLQKIKAINPAAKICFYGLYAPMNSPLLQALGADAIIGGEFETALLQFCQDVRAEHISSRAPVVQTALDRQQFIRPRRDQLPDLSRYARMNMPDGSARITGYVEATRGCKHKCRHCPIVPVYNGRFRIVQKEIVLEDIRQQVAAGAEHITFGDPDFLNGPGHAFPLVEALRREFPQLTYDVIIKVEHLLKYADELPLLRKTGCVLVTSAIEAVDDSILDIFDKGHTRSDIYEAVGLLRQHDLPLNPTFVAFTPWTSLAGYRDFLHTIAELDLVEQVSPVQLAIRLLIPRGSKLLDLPETHQFIEQYDQDALSYRWRHPDPRVDELAGRLMQMISVANRRGLSRREIFQNAWQAVNEMLGEFRDLPETTDRATIPYLNEPWYC